MSATLSCLPDEAQLKAWGIPLAMERHGVLTMPTEQLALALGPKVFVEFLRRRHDAILAERQNPYDAMWVHPMWRRVMADVAEMEAAGIGTKVVLINGGNRGGKSQGAAWWLNHVLAEKGGRRGLHLHTKRDMAVQTTMRYLFDTMPSPCKPPPGKASVGRNPVHSVSYSQARGFSDDVYVFPNSSECRFGYYGNDIRTVEGPEYDVIWADEEIPLKWVQTLMFRLTSRRGLMIITFTPVNEEGTPVVMHFLKGARVLARSPLQIPEKPVYEGPEIGPAAIELPVTGEGGVLRGYGREEEGPDGRQVLVGLPRVWQCAEPNARAYTFWTIENPYNPYEETAKVARMGGSDAILSRLYGLVTTVAGSLFRITEAHILKRERVKDLPQGGQWVQVVDPGGARNQVGIWVYAVGRRAFIMREWPQPGRWPFAPLDLTDEARRTEAVLQAGRWAVALPSSQESKVKHDGYAGPAQRSLRWGFEQYRTEYLRVEAEMAAEWTLWLGGVERIWPALRIMDSRAANTVTMATSSAITPLQSFATLPGQPLFFTPASGDRIKAGVELLQDWLSYDMTRPVDTSNEPRLMIHEDCLNTIMALSMWTGRDGEGGALKDFVDLVRYFVQGWLVMPEGGDESWKDEGGGF